MGRPFTFAFKSVRDNASFSSRYRGVYTILSQLLHAIPGIVTGRSEPHVAVLPICSPLEWGLKLAGSGRFAASGLLCYCPRCDRFFIVVRVFSNIFKEGSVSGAQGPLRCTMDAQRGQPPWVLHWAHVRARLLWCGVKVIPRILTETQHFVRLYHAGCGATRAGSNRAVWFRDQENVSFPCQQSPVSKYKVPVKSLQRTQQRLSLSKIIISKPRAFFREPTSA